MIEVFAVLFAFLCFIIELFMMWTVWWVYEQTGGFTLPVLMWGIIVFGMIGLFHSEVQDA